MLVSGCFPLVEKKSSYFDKWPLELGSHVSGAEALKVRVFIHSSCRCFAFSLQDLEGYKEKSIYIQLENNCRAPLHEDCPKHHGHKGDPGMTPGTCCAVGERAQVILVWARAPSVRNSSYPRRLRGMKVGPNVAYDMVIP